MTTKLAFMITCVFIIASCSINDNGNTSIPAQIITQEWHLSKSLGGFSGVNNQFPLETVVWVFNAENGTISVTNNNLDSTKEDAFSTGIYQYSTLDVGDDTYIIIEEEEFGKITSSNNDEITINQNQKSTGSSADLYIYTFNRKLITTDVTID